MAIIKKRLKIDVSFYTILQILSFRIFEQIHEINRLPTRYTIPTTTIIN